MSNLKSKVDGIESHITKKYEIQKRLGKGAYGIVWRALDRKKERIVALKKIFDAFQNATDAQRTYREVFFLQEFGNHDNVIKLLNVIPANSDKDIYLVFEYMDTDLYAANKGGILQDIHKKYITYQIFKAIKYLHSGNVIHRDLKPSNILLNEHCFVKVCDFGLARSLTVIEEDETLNPQMTDYVATRWYRAPEILLGSLRYTAGIDMWSIGCIMGELLSGKPLFAGTSTLNQLDIILGNITKPEPDDIMAINAPYAAGVIERHQSSALNGTLERLIPNCPDDALELIKSLLHFNPDKRSNAEFGCRSEYCAKFANRGSEITLNHDVVPPLNDNVQLSAAQYRTKLYEDIVRRKEAMKSRTGASVTSSEDSKDSPVTPTKEDVDSGISNNSGESTSSGLSKVAEDNHIVDQRRRHSIQNPPMAADNVNGHDASYTVLNAPYATTPVKKDNFRRVRSAGNVAGKTGASDSSSSPDKQYHRVKSSLQNTGYRSYSAGHAREQGGVPGRQPAAGPSPDLTVSSSRVMPNTRGSPARANGRRPIGCNGNPSMPPRYGTSTQQHGTVTKGSLNALKARQWL